MRVVVIENVTLDGVMQTPARADEDPRDGFAHSGWAIPFNDSVMAEDGRAPGADLGVLGSGALVRTRHRRQLPPRAVRDNALATSRPSPPRAPR